jgi:phosphatidylglycerophosphate synthase
METDTSQKVESKRSVLPYLQKIKRLYLKSVKPFYTEELVNTFIFRPAGFLLAIISRIMHISPNILSIIRGIIGLCGGVFFFIGTPGSIFTGAILLLISQCFDNADGQLARIIDNFSHVGVILDGIGDGISIIAVYFGTAAMLFRQNPETGAYWWVLSCMACVCLLMHIYTQGFLRYEYFLYEAHNAEKTWIKKVQNERINLSELRKKIKAEKKPIKKLSLALIFLLNTGLNLASKIILIKKYRGYTDFHTNDNDYPQEKMESFGKHYTLYNGWILLLFNNLGLISNQLIFIGAGLCNRLDCAFYIILFASNLYFILCVIIQRISFAIQIKKIS